MQAAPTDSADRLIAEGNRAEDSGELLRACELYRQALALAPRYAKAHINLGIALEAMGDGTGAIRSYEQVLAADPANPAANYNLGKLVHVRGELSRAEELLTRALQGRPDFPEARIVLGSVLASQGKWQQARTELEEALRQRPDDFGALFHYAGVLRALNRLDDARTMLQRALAIDPSNADAHAALSDVLCAQSDLAGATAELEAVLTQRPDWADALHNYGCILRRQLRLAEAESAFRRALAAQPGHASTCRMLGEVLLAQCRTEEAFEHYRVARRHCPPADVWSGVTGLSHAQLPDAIAADEIDVLVVLAGHSGIPQLAAMAQRPAPVQVTWLGYLNTTGLTRIDYRISDRFADPPGITDRYHTEGLIRLPHSQWCYRPFLSPPVAAIPPSANEGFVTFGAFHQSNKMSPVTRRLWAQVLAAVPDSRLVIVGVPRGRTEDDLRRDLVGPEVGPERITTVPYRALEDYLRGFDAVDIAL